MYFSLAINQYTSGKGRTTESHFISAPNALFKSVPDHKLYSFYLFMINDVIRRHCNEMTLNNECK